MANERQQQTAKYDERRQKTFNNCNFRSPDISLSAEVYILLINLPKCFIITTLFAVFRRLLGFERTQIRLICGGLRFSGRPHVNAHRWTLEYCDYTQCANCRGTKGVQPPLIFTSTDSFLSENKIDFKFQPLCKISDTLTFAPPQFF